MLGDVGSGVATGLVVLAIRALLPRRVVARVEPYVAFLGAIAMFAMAAFLAWAFFSGDSGCADCDEPAGRVAGIAMSALPLALGCLAAIRGWSQLRARRSQD